MSYYTDWMDVIGANADDSNYIKSFLRKSNESNNVWLLGSREELIEAAKVLLCIPIDRIVAQINGDYEFVSRDIVQYSSFENGIRKICSILEFDIEEAGYTELGELLYHSESAVAKKKYGENHSKLADEFSLVKICRTRGYRICNSAFGSFSIALEDKEFYQLLRRLGLRNNFNKALIGAAKNGVIYYDEFASRVLKSEKTKARRKSNVKEMLTFCLEEDSEILSNIIWS